MTDNRLVEPLDAHFDRVPPSWRAATEGFRVSATGRRLIEFIDGRLKDGAEIYPREPLRALTLTPLGEVRAVILGQDPYHGPGQAEGLAFSVPAGVRIPPSLRNIRLEYEADLGVPAPMSGSLAGWARSGVLLLNATLTVERGVAASHAGNGWEVLTDSLFEVVARQGGALAFLLWGAHAQAKAHLAERHGRHLVIKSNHPSPLSARRPPVPFLGSRPFSRAAQFVRSAGGRLDWALPDAAD